MGKTVKEVFEYLKGGADLNEYSLKIRYRNFRGDEIIYSADPESLYNMGEFVVVRLAPTGRLVTFRRSRIQNRSEVEAVLNENPQPATNERRVLRYHLRRGSTSPAFERLREKYPRFQR